MNAINADKETPAELARSFAKRAVNKAALSRDIYANAVLEKYDPEKTIRDI